MVYLNAEFSQDRKATGADIGRTDMSLSFVEAVTNSKIMMSGGGLGSGQDGGTDLKERTDTKPRVEKPKKYKVLILNDDFTSMDYVVDILQRFFQKDYGSAFQIMMDVHKKGIGIAGVYPFDVAETKQMQVMDDARKNEHPLMLKLEKE